MSVTLPGNWYSTDVQALERRRIIPPAAIFIAWANAGLAFTSIKDAPTFDAQLFHDVSAAFRISTRAIQYAWEALRSDAEVLKPCSMEDVGYACAAAWHEIKRNPASVITWPAKKVAEDARNNRDTSVPGTLVISGVFGTLSVITGAASSIGLCNSGSPVVFAAIAAAPAMGLSLSRRKQIRSAISFAYDKRHDLFRRTATTLAERALKAVGRLADNLTVFNNVDLLIRDVTQPKIKTSTDIRREKTSFRGQARWREHHLRTPPRGALVFAYGGSR